MSHVTINSKDTAPNLKFKVMKSKHSLTLLAAFAILILAGIAYFLLSAENKNNNSEEPNSLSKTNILNGVQNLDVSLEVTLPSFRNEKVVRHLEVNLDSLICRTLEQYMDSKLGAIKTTLRQHAEAYTAMRSRILTETESQMRVNPLASGDLITDILVENLYNNIHLIANWQHYLSQDERLDIFTDDDLIFIRKMQAIHNALRNDAFRSGIDNPEINLEDLENSVNRDMICELSYSYKNLGELLSSDVFGDGCISSSIRSRNDFSFLQEYIQLGQPLTRPNFSEEIHRSGSFGGGNITFDCSYLSLGSNEVHSRISNFLIPGTPYPIKTIVIADREVEL